MVFMTMFSKIEKDLQESVKRQMQVQEAARVAGLEIQETESPEVTEFE